jgi:hypothetical protein
MHGVRRFRGSAGRGHAPLRWVDLPYPCSNADYEAIMAEVAQAVSEGVTHVGFGDSFTEVRRIVSMLAGTGLTPLFRLRRPTLHNWQK